MGVEIFVSVLLLAIGLLLIIKGGDWFVDAAGWMAKASGIPTFIIGATVVSVATTLPEIIVSVMAASAGNTSLAIGNAIGSVNCNVALIMAISLIFMPASFKRRDYATKMIILIVAICILWALCATGILLVEYAAIMLFIFLLFMAENVYSAKKKSKVVLTLADAIKVDTYNQVYFDENISINGDGSISKIKGKSKVTKKEVAKNLFLFAIGTAGIAGGAKLLIDNATTLAEFAGIPASVIGVTIVAIGTSLPELVTTITAIIKKKSDLAIGNIIGANIINMTLILPICSMIAGGALPVGPQTLGIDFQFALAVNAFAFIPALVMGKFYRWQGFVLLGGYAAYLGILISQFI